MNYRSIFLYHLVVLYGTYGPVSGLDYPLDVDELKFEGGMFRDSRSQYPRIAPAQNNYAQDTKLFEYWSKDSESDEYVHVFDFELSDMYSMVANVIAAKSFVPSIDPQSHKVYIRFKTREQAREFRYLELFPSTVFYKRSQLLEMVPSSSTNTPQVDEFHYELSDVLVYKDGVKKLYTKAMLDSVLIPNEKRTNINIHQFRVHRVDDEDARESELIFSTGKFGISIWPNVRDRTVLAIKITKRISITVCLVFANADDGEKFQEKIRRHNDDSIVPIEQEETLLQIANLATVADIDS